MDRREYVFGEYYSILTAVFVAAKHFNVFDTSIFLETEVFTKYFKKWSSQTDPQAAQSDGQKTARS